MYIVDGHTIIEKRCQPTPKYPYEVPEEWERSTHFYYEDDGRGLIKVPVQLGVDAFDTMEEAINSVLPCLLEKKAEIDEVLYKYQEYLACAEMTRMNQEMGFYGEG